MEKECKKQRSRGGGGGGKDEDRQRGGMERQMAEGKKSKGKR